MAKPRTEVLGSRLFYHRSNRNNRREGLLLFIEKEAEAHLEIKLEGMLLERGGDIALIVEIIAGGGLYINAHEGEQIVLRTETQQG